MSFWDFHFLAGFGLALLIGIISGIGYYKYRTRLTSLESKAGRFILWLGFFFSLALLHLWLDIFNPILFIGG
jgi:hypothetical protein